MLCTNAINTSNTIRTQTGAADNIYNYNTTVNCGDKTIAPVITCRMPVVYTLIVVALEYLF